MHDLFSKGTAIKEINRFIPSNPLKDDYTQGISVGIALAEACIERLAYLQQEEMICKNCIIHGVCTYECGLGEYGFCSQWKRA